MYRFQTFRLPLALMALVCSAALAAAGTGPGEEKVPQPGPVGQQGKGLSSKALVTYLEDQGHGVETKTANNGAVTVFANIKSNGWTFAVEVEYTTDGKTFHICTPLTKSADQMPAPQLLKLMKWQYDNP